MSSSKDTAAGDFDAELASVERFISDVQQGNVPTGEAMRAYRDVHRPAIDRLRAQLAEFEALLDATQVDTIQIVGEGSSSSA
jgi:chorismate-pyruvate lyase